MAESALMLIWIPLPLCGIGIAEKSIVFQNIFSESSRIVTGPEFTSSTSIMA